MVRMLLRSQQRIQSENPEVVIVTNELGYGVVPVDAFDRNFREATGRVCTQLAEAADEVCRVVCGDRTGDQGMRMYLIRHSITYGNTLGRYIGTTDEPLCQEGVELLQKKYIRGGCRLCKPAEAVYGDGRDHLSGKTGTYH